VNNRTPVFFYRIFENIADCFRGYNLLWHLLAMILTFFLVTTGIDWLYLQSTRNVILQACLSPAVRLGSRLPVLAPLVLYIFGKVKKNAPAVRTAGALGQSVIIGLFISSLFKAFTGRAHPPRFLAPDTFDSSREFHFGFMRNGVFWGWPSSHTTIAFAMSVAFFMLYPANKTARYLALVYALYIGFGVSISIHWLSDFVAGAMLGSVIGVVVGRGFRAYSA
jgi:membrane-associated phospholipid phosphatase